MFPRPEAAVPHSRNAERGTGNAERGTRNQSRGIHAASQRGTGCYLIRAATRVMSSVWPDRPMYRFTSQ